MSGVARMAGAWHQALASALEQLEQDAVTQRELARTLKGLLAQVPTHMAPTEIASLMLNKHGFCVVGREQAVVLAELVKQRTEGDVEHDQERELLGQLALGLEAQIRRAWL